MIVAHDTKPQRCSSTITTWEKWETRKPRQSDSTYDTWDFDALICWDLRLKDECLNASSGSRGQAERMTDVWDRQCGFHLCRFNLGDSGAAVVIS